MGKRQVLGTIWTRLVRDRDTSLCVGRLQSHEGTGKAHEPIAFITSAAMNMCNQIVFDEARA